jgi:hypothetical protein
MPVDTTAPPSLNRPPSANAKKATARTTGKLNARQEAVNGVFQLAGFGLIVAGQHADAGALGEHGPAISHELAALSEKNSKVAAFIDSLTEAGPYAGLVIAVMPLVLQILANHKIVKGDLSAAGVIAPEVLEAQVKTELARKQAAAIIAQHEAEDQLQHLQDSNGRHTATMMQDGTAE